MTQIMKKAAFETSQAIWEYNPSDPDSRVLGGSLDVIAALRTLSTKIQASGQRILEFRKIQIEVGIINPLSLILHGNTRWGSVYGMVDHGIKLAKVCHLILFLTISLFCYVQAINRFIQVADVLFGSITIIRKNGKIEKKIPWSAFTFSDNDWMCVKDCRSILKVWHIFFRSHHTLIVLFIVS